MFKKIRKEVGDLPIEIQDESSESKQAIVSFLTHEEAKAALEEFNGTKIEGREIKIYFTSQNIVYTQEHEEEEDYEEYDDYEDYEDDAEEYPEGYEEHLKEFLEQNNEDYDEYDDYDDDYYRKKKKGKVKYIPVDPEPPTTKKDETKQETKEEPKEKPKEEVKKEEVKEESKEKQKEQPKAEQKEESKKESKSEKVKSKENKPEQTTDTKKEKQSKGVETKKESKEPIARIAYVSVKDLPKTNIPTIKNALKATFGNDIGIGLIDYDAEKGTATIDLVVPKIPVSPFGKKIKIGDAEIMLRKRNIMKPKSPQPMQQVEQKEEQKEVPKKAPEEKRTTKPVKEDTPKESPNKEEQKKHYPKKDKYQHHDKRQYRRGGDYKGDKRGNRDGKKEYDYTATFDLLYDLRDLDEKQLGIVFGRIIGKDGENIRRIGKETNAFLDLNKDSKILKINSNDRRFKAQAAAEKVRKIIEECKKGFSEKK